jgi:hypothetical protein
LVVRDFEADSLSAIVINRKGELERKTKLESDLLGMLELAIRGVRAVSAWCPRTHPWECESPLIDFVALSRKNTRRFAAENLAERTHLRSEKVEQTLSSRRLEKFRGTFDQRTKTAAAGSSKKSRKKRSLTGVV